MKNEILRKLFSSKWNYAWGKVDEHLISLFYRKGSFHGLYEYIVSEKERMNKDKNYVFSNYYSSDLVETLESALRIELKDEDFRKYIFESYNLSFNKNNFEKLEEYGLLQYFYDFGGSFRGDIVTYHKIGDYGTIETFSKKEGKRFYNKAEFSTCFGSLEEAIIYKIYNGKYFDTLITLLESTKSDNVK